MRISRIRLSDKTSRRHPRHAAPTPGQAYEPEVPAEMREWPGPAAAPPDLVFGTQPPAQPHGGIAIERPIRLGDSANTEVVGPSAQRAVQPIHQLRGLLPATRPAAIRLEWWP